MQHDDEKWELPEPFNVAKRPELLALNDEEQKDRISRFKDGNPVFTRSPRDRMRQIAAFEIEALRNTADVRELTADEVRRLAEHYAMLGDYEKAATLDEERAELYQKYIAALEMPDDEWCQHPDRHKYIKEYIWDARHEQETTLIACNVCGTWNATDVPSHVSAAEARRAQIRHETAGMTHLEARAHMANNYRINDV